MLTKIPTPDSASFATPASPAEAAARQRELAAAVTLTPLPGPVRRVLGADVHFAGDRGFAALVVLDAETLAPLETAAAEAVVDFPYLSGFLAFREIPPILAAFTQLSCPPDLLLCDGQGIAHPRGMGLAAHLGVVLGLPAIGCAKSRLVGVYDPIGPTRGCRAELHYGGRRVGSVLRTRDGTAPLFVSPGHLVDFADAEAWTLKCCRRFRLPEPTRQAHLAARRQRKEAL